jgi:hypothetical protein
MTATRHSIIVSQSMIKDVRRYVNKDLCGRVLKAKYIDKDFPENGDDSPEKKLGRYFEYILTGATGRGGEVPKPVYTKTALAAYRKDPLRNRLQVSGMTKPYQLAHKNAERVKKYFKEMKIRPLETSVYIKKGGMEGTIDVIASYKGKRIVIDVKYSGLIDDKYNDMGWRWTNEQAKFHGTQALQYHILTSTPFYFLVVSSTNEFDIKFMEVQFDDFSIEQHMIEVEDTRKKMDFYNEFGFNPLPELKRCLKCALKERCDVKATAPEPMKVYLVSND